MTVLLDEDTSPPLRAVIGSLLRAAQHVDLAICHLRLAALDLADSEIAAFAGCRILLRMLDANGLSELNNGGPADHHSVLLRLALSDRVELRSSGIGSWTPDFSLFRGVEQEDGRRSDVCILGAHYFREPPALMGPSFSCVIRSADAVARVQQRFEELWRAGHDIRQPVAAALTDARTSS